MRDVIGRQNGDVCCQCISRYGFLIFLLIMSLSSTGIYGELYVRPYSTWLTIFLKDFWAVSSMIGHVTAGMDGRKRQNGEVI